MLEERPLDARIQAHGGIPCARPSWGASAVPGAIRRRGHCGSDPSQTGGRSAARLGKIDVQIARRGGRFESGSGRDAASQAYAPFRPSPEPSWTRLVREAQATTRGRLPRQWVTRTTRCPSTGSLQPSQPSGSVLLENRAGVSAPDPRATPKSFGRSPSARDTSSMVGTLYCLLGHGFCSPNCTG
jgi:hypothetical protein